MRANETGATAGNPRHKCCECGAWTFGAISKVSGRRWAMICQPCKDAADAAYERQLAATAKFIDKLNAPKVEAPLVMTGQGEYTQRWWASKLSDAATVALNDHFNNGQCTGYLTGEPPIAECADCGMRFDIESGDVCK